MSAQLTFDLDLKIDKAKKILEELRKEGSNVSKNIANDFDKNLNNRKDIGLSFGKLVGANIVSGLLLSGIENTAEYIKNQIVDVTKVTIQFSDQLLVVKGALSASNEEMEILREEALRLNAISPFNAVEIAEGQAFLAQAGFTMQEILNSMPEMLSLASAGQLELGQASDIASSVLRQFNIDAEDTARVTNLLAKVSVDSKAQILDIGEAMKYLGPTAKSLGFTLEETGAIVGILGNNGIRGSLAGRALGTSLVRLASPTERMQGIMSKYNLSFFDSQGNMKSFIDILGTLEKGIGSLNEEAKAEAIYNLFGAEAYQEMSILLNNGSEAYSNFVKNVTGTNTANEMATTMESGIGGALRRLKSQFESLQISFLNTEIGGASLESHLANAFGKIDKLLSKVDFQRMADSIVNFVLPSLKEIDLVGLVAGISAVVGVLVGEDGKNLVDFLKKVGSEYLPKIIDTTDEFFTNYGDLILNLFGWIKSDAIPLIGSFATAFILVSTVVSVATGAMTLFGTIMAFIVSPIGIIVIAIGTLIWIIYSLIQNWGWLSDKTKEVVESISAGLSYGVKFWIGLLVGIGTAIWNFGGMIGDAILNVKDFIFNGVGDILDFLQNRFLGGWNLIWNTANSIIDRVTSSMVSNAKSRVGQLIDNFNTVIDSVNRVGNSIESVSGGKVNVADVPKLSKPQGFTNGGIVEGNSFWGDRINAKVNSGEMILNHKHQKGLFDLIDKIGNSTTTNNNYQNYYGVDNNSKFTNPNILQIAW